MPSRISRYLWCLFVGASLALSVQAEDLNLKKSLSVNGNQISKSEVSLKGARERSVTQLPSGIQVSLRQCDLHRTVSLNEQAQTYYVVNDPQDEAEARAAALVSGIPQADSGGKITITTTTVDTGERKSQWGFTARHLRTTVTQESSANACSQVSQKMEIDGWYIDAAKEQAACAQAGPPIPQKEGCHDQVLLRHSGSGKPGYPLSEIITLHNSDGSSTKVTNEVTFLSKQALEPELFDVPANYKQVNSLAELHGLPSQPAVAQAPAPQPSAAPAPASMPNPMAMQQAAYQQMAGMNFGPNGMPGQQQAPSTAVGAPKVLGPKQPGKIRVGIAPPDAQVGQGSNAGGDYSTPIRNSIVLLMDGPAVEIAALDSRIPMQLQAEAQQKQCDYVLFSSVAVKHPKGGFGSFMKMAGPMASMVPMAGMAGGMGGAVAAQAAGMAASAAAQAAQQQAMNQLAGFNGQIKQKDDVTVQYQLFPTGQTTPRLQNTLQAKAKSDGEDVLTPAIQQIAMAVLTEVTRK